MFPSGEAWLFMTVLAALALAIAAAVGLVVLGVAAHKEVDEVDADADVRPYRMRRHGPLLSYKEIARRLNNRSFEIFHPLNTSDLFGDPSVASIAAMFGPKVEPSIRNVTSGHVVQVPDPLHTFSVYPPWPHGCPAQTWNSDTNTTTAHGPDGRAPVKQTSDHYKCSVALNAGFFDTHTGECHGNLISDGKLLQTHGAPNVNFGVLADGSIFVGYLDHETIISHDPPFVQLIAGVIWLVRNGQPFVADDMQLEDGSTQESGSLNNFVNVNSARVALGHDRFGNIKIAQFDGKTNSYGPNLNDVAEMLIADGFVNAINLDGGGSATFVVNGTVASDATDNCPEENCNFDRWHSKLCRRCTRHVTTALCVHQPICYNCNVSQCETKPCFSDSPTLTPTIQPITLTPSNQPTVIPSALPSNSPSVRPTLTPSLAPSLDTSRIALASATTATEKWRTAFFACAVLELATVIGFLLSRTPACRKKKYNVSILGNDDHIASEPLIEECLEDNISNSYANPTFSLDEDEDE